MRTTTMVKTTIHIQEWNCKYGLLKGKKARL